MPITKTTLHTGTVKDNSIEFILVINILFAISVYGFFSGLYDLAVGLKYQEDDFIICCEGEKIIAKTDSTSLPFISGSKIDFVEELGASYFKVFNPNASSNCGCGSSFAI